MKKGVRMIVKGVGDTADSFFKGLKKTGESITLTAKGKWGKKKY